MEISEKEKAEVDRMLSEAREYNRRKPMGTGARELTDKEIREYENILDPLETGVMGYIEISKINMMLPIYHGTEENVLQVAVGHLEWSSLPVGGESTHCVLSGHTGLPGAKLFTDIDELQKGDTFTINVLSETLTYEVDQIKTVLPEETEDLRVFKGKDYCTLVTCTPYGVNTHRLLVRGHRVPNSEYVLLSNEAISLDMLLIDGLIVSLLLLMIIIYIRIVRGERNA